MRKTVPILMDKPFKTALLDNIHHKPGEGLETKLDEDDVEAEENCFDILDCRRREEGGGKRIIADETKKNKDYDR